MQTWATMCLHVFIGLREAGIPAGPVSLLFLSVWLFFSVMDIFIVRAGFKPAPTRQVKHCYCWEFFKKLNRY